MLLTDEMIDPETLLAFPPEMLNRFQAVPIPDAMGGVTLVMTDPLDDEAFAKIRALAMPVMSAVKMIIARRDREPYFSSMIGPMRRRSIILPIKCAQVLCTKGWVKSPT